MKALYLDCFSGISGDMTLAALLDLGVPEAALLEELAKLPVSGYRFRAGKGMRGALAGTHVTIEIGPQPHRHFADIRRMIEDSTLAPDVIARSLAVFERLAAAESEVHGVPPDHVHFHEVGALDSILDVVGSVAALKLIGAEKIFSSPIPTGSGFVETAHGRLPVPAPATALLLRGAPVYDNGIPREITTPTGAALATTLAEAFGPLPVMRLTGVGIGLGTHPAADPPNALRIMAGDLAEALPSRRLLVVEASIDDMNPQVYGHVMERLLALGARDVNLIPVHMKKNRPAVLLRVLCDPSLRNEVTEAVFTETTTLGLRLHEVERVELPRRMETVETAFGPIRVKVGTLPGGSERPQPEYEDCRAAARTHRVPLRAVYDAVAAALAAAAPRA